MKQMMFDFLEVSIMPTNSRQGLKSDLFKAQNQMGQRKRNAQFFLIKCIPNPELFIIGFHGQIS